MIKFLLFLLFFSNIVCAAEVTIFGSAQTPSGKPDTAYFSFNEPKVESPEIIKEAPQSPKEKPLPEILKAEKLKEIRQFSPQNPKPFSVSPKAEQNDIENTLYEGGNRIYDVQSFPLKDIKTITEPNVDPTISTYPEY